MRVSTKVAGALGSLCLLGGALAAPAMAQSAYTPTAHWDIGMIELVDGQGEAYMNFLASQWRSEQEFAKQRGWIKDYYVLANSNSRDGEPDLYLVTVSEELPNRAEEEVQRAAYIEWANRNIQQLEAESGARVTMRRQMGSVLLRQLDLKAGQ